MPMPSPQAGIATTPATISVARAANSLTACAAVSHLEHAMQPIELEGLAERG